MYKFIKNLNNFWNDYGFEIVLLGIIGIIFFIYLSENSQYPIQGTWTPLKHLKYLDPIIRLSNYKNIKQRNSSSPPTESKGEKECRRVLEKIFNLSFPKIRPMFLNNPVTGGNHNLELDCYNERLRLAVEYSGAQHYKYIPYFHKNKETFLNQKYRDQMKKYMCKENDVCLIEVPYTVKEENIESYLRKKLRENGYNI